MSRYPSAGVLIALAQGHAYAKPIRFCWRQTVATETRQDWAWNAFKSKTDQAGAMCVFQACVRGCNSEKTKRTKKSEWNVTAIVSVRDTTDFSIKSNRIKNIDRLLFVFWFGARLRPHMFFFCPPKDFLKLHSSFHIKIQDHIYDQQMCRTHRHTSLALSTALQTSEIEFRGLVCWGFFVCDYSMTQICSK